MGSYYGSYRTRTFADIFPDLPAFMQMYNQEKIPQKLSELSITTLYYLLYARYGNSHIAFDDEHQFKYSVLSTIFMYGPSWEKRLEIQEALRGLTESDLMQGSKAIYNHALNPGTAPGTESLEELSYINDQNTTNYKKSKLNAYAELIALLETDVTERFIFQFKKLFITIVAPDYPLLYEQDPLDYEI